jgi:hypothetical protein
MIRPGVLARLAAIASYAREARSEPWTGLHQGDNLPIMRKLHAHGARVHLAYLDGQQVDLGLDGFEAA